MIKKLMIVVMLMAFLSTASSVFAEDVFTTKRGKKYHKQICRLIKNKGAMTTHEKDAAVETGYQPCRRCYKEDIITDENKEEEEEVVEESK